VDALAGSREKAVAGGRDEFDIKPVQFAWLLPKYADYLKAEPTIQAAHARAGNT
jgi:hypothetical protein